MKKAQGIVEVALLMAFVAIVSIAIMINYGHLTNKDGALMKMSKVKIRQAPVKIKTTVP